MAGAAPAWAERNLDSTTFELKSGISLATQLERVGINKADAEGVAEELGNVYAVNKIAAGQRVKVNFEIMDMEGREIRFSSMEIKISTAQKIQVSRVEGDIFFTHVFESKVQPKLMYVHATVGTTLFSAATKAGISHEMFNEFVKAYSYDVDFQRDVVQGNELEVLYEAVYDEDGKLVSDGDILYISLSISRGRFTLYNYTTPDGKSEYYDEKGQNVRKSLLRTPVNGARISSGYGSRTHPILGFSKVHKGVDFAAPTGTPVYAAGEGVVLEAKRKGSYGKYIRIYHNGPYETIYAHLNGFAKGIQRSAKVTQAQVIGYVGSTGRSTGPHLHYEVINKGSHVNPLMVSSDSGKRLSGTEKDLFLKYRDAMQGTITRMSAKSQ